MSRNDVHELFQQKLNTHFSQRNDEVQQFSRSCAEFLSLTLCPRSHYTPRCPVSADDDRMPLVSAKDRIITTIFYILIQNDGCRQNFKSF